MSVGLFIIVLDNSSMNIALPTVARYFQTDLPNVQWVVVGYNLAVTALLLPVGRLADVLGRKRVYIAGFSFFAAGAALGTFAPNLPVVVLAKVLQGVGSASLVVNTVAIALLVFPDSERGKVMGLNFIVLGLGGVSGPVLGGLLVSAFGWRSVFAFSLPVVVIAVIMAVLILDERRISQESDGTGRLRFDWMGAGLSTLVLIAFLLSMSAGQREGFGSPLVVAGFIGAGVLLGGFVWWELATKEPMLELRWFRRGAFSLPVFAGFISFLGGASVIFMMPFYLQRVLDYTPREAGLIISAFSIAVGVTGPISGRLSDRYGTRWLSVLGLALYIVGLLLLSGLTTVSSLLYVLAAIAITGCGVGTFQPPNASTILSTRNRSDYGVVNGMLNLIRTGAWVIGIVLITTVVSAVMGSMGYEPSFEAVSGTSGEGVQRAFTAGVRYVYLGLVGLIALGVLAIVVQRPQGIHLEVVAEPRHEELVPPSGE